MLVKHGKATAFYILDNGANTAKIGVSSAKAPNVIPNCIMKVKSERRRMFIGDQIDECRDASGLFYILPFQKGYLVNWDIQKTLWDYIFAKEIVHGKLCNLPICVTEPIYNFQSNQDAMDEIFFEEYDCCGVLRLTAADLAAYKYSRANDRCENCLVVDTGYSFTHIVPYVHGKMYLPGVKRIDVGGKVLTNYLKEIISYRQLHVMDETYVINQVKEDGCFVSNNFRMQMTQTLARDIYNPILREYVLPDYSTLRRGYLREVCTGDPSAKKAKVTPEVSNIHVNTQVNGFKVNDDNHSTIPKPLTHNNHVHKTTYNYVHKNAHNYVQSPAQTLTIEQTIQLNNERITIPEILFHPSDIGIAQKGIAEALVQSIEECPENSRYALLANIVVCGGNANFENFKSRLYSEVKQRFDENINVQVTVPQDPVTYPWFGGKLLTQTPDEFYSYMVSKTEYTECGTDFVREKFAKFKIGKP